MAFLNVESYKTFCIKFVVITGGNPTTNWLNFKFSETYLSKYSLSLYFHH